MTDQTNAALVAEARRYVSDHDVYADNHLLRGLADALEAAETLRSMADAYRAEVEQERDNWRLSAEEAARAEKRWKDCAVEADRQARAAEAEAEHLHEEDTREIVALTQERDQYAAVVEKVRAWMEEPGDADEVAFEELDSILATAPADALREVKAEAWEEGYRSGYIEGQADAHRLDPDDIEETPNPYADSPRHNAPQRREEQS